MNLHDIMWQDCVIIGAFVLYLGTGFATNYAITTISAFTSAAAELESNPVARQALNTQYGLFSLQAATMAILGGVYYMVRRNYKKDLSESSNLMLSFYSIAIFLVFMQNLLNDFPIALKIFMETLKI